MQFRLKRPLVLYLFFLSALFILNTVRNKLLIYSPSAQSILLFSAIAFFFTFVCFLFCKLLLKDKIRAGLLSLVIIIFSFYYFDIYYSLFDFKFPRDIISNFFFSKFHVVLVVLMFALLFAIYFLLKRIKQNLARVNTYFNLVFFLFLLLEIYKMVSYKKFDIVLTNQARASEIHFNPDSIQKRNIYYIVLDSYTSSSSLKKYWSYDNAELEKFLSEKGFFIADKSNCNYNSTPFSIVSSLNMSYLNFGNYDQAQNVQISRTYNLIEKNAVSEILSSNGYEIKNLSLFDLQSATAFYEDPFYKKENLFDRTILFLITEKFNITHEHERLLSLSKINTDIFSKLISSSIRPTFFYAHLMMPHFPYFFDSKGNAMAEVYARSEENRKEKYLEQLKYTNHLLMESINKILSESKTQPIIIIQGDHGFRDLKELGMQERIEESKTIFNAYLLPESEKKLLCDSISPVNSFRIVFNQYFKTDLSLLEDKFYNTEIKQ